jgi:hypothetical protein
LYTSTGKKRQRDVTDDANNEHKKAHMSQNENEHSLPHTSKPKKATKDAQRAYTKLLNAVLALLRTKTYPSIEKFTGIILNDRTAGAPSATYHFNFQKVKVFGFNTLEGAAYVRDYFILKCSKSAFPKGLNFPLKTYSSGNELIKEEEIEQLYIHLYTKNIDTTIKSQPEVKRRYWKMIDLDTLHKHITKTYDHMKKEEYACITFHEPSSVYHFKLNDMYFDGFTDKFTAAVCREYLFNIFSTFSRWQRNFALKVPRDMVLDKCLCLSELRVTTAAKAFLHEVNCGPTKECSVCHTLHFPQYLYSYKNLQKLCSRCCSDAKRGFLRYSSEQGFVLKPIPKELQGLSRLEELCIAPFVPFMNIRLLRRFGHKTLLGGIVSVPVRHMHIRTILPNFENKEQNICLAFRRQLEAKYSYQEGNIHPRKIHDALHYLTTNSKLFKECHIFHNTSANIPLSEQDEQKENSVPIYDIDDSDQESEANTEQSTENHSESSHNHDVEPKPVHHSMLNDVRDYYILKDNHLHWAPCENETPQSLFDHPHLEELCFPTVFGGEKQPQPNSDHDISKKDIIKWELTHVDRRFCSSIENIFFKFEMSQRIAIHSNISIRGRRGRLQDITYESLCNATILQTLHEKNLLFREFKTVRGTPQYWDEVKKDIFAMLRQLSNPPTFFMSLSMADTRWVPLLKALLEIKRNRQVSDDEVEQLTPDEKMKLVQDDPVTCSRYFNHKRRAFLNTLLKQSGILGQVTDYFGVVEFQFRGSPHCHILIWVKDAPRPEDLKDTNVVTSVENFCDTHISTDVDDLSEAVRYVQEHKHSPRCQHKTTKECAFGFPRPPMDRTMVLPPLDNTISSSALQRAKNNMTKINTALSSNDLEDISLETFIDNLDISFEDYILAIRSTLTKVSIMYKRKVIHRNVNPFNKFILEAWGANMDIQFTLHAHAVGVYIASYMCKGNKYASNVLRQMFKAMNKSTKKFGTALHEVGNAMLNAQEVSAPEACYIMLGLPLRFSSRSFLFINTSHKKDRVHMLKPKKILESQEDKDDIFFSYALLERYCKRPRTAVFDDMCLADFASWYSTKKQTKIITDDIREDENNADVDERTSPREQLNELSDTCISKLTTQMMGSIASITSCTYHFVTSQNLKQETKLKCTLRTLIESRPKQRSTTRLAPIGKT